MRIFLLADACSIHTVRWANGLNDLGHVISIASFTPKSTELHQDIIVHHLNIPKHFRFVAPYIYSLWVRKIVNVFEPDIVHAHYATSYGTLSRLVGFHPSVISMWGSDILIFPYISIFHKLHLRKNLCFHDAICSTSHAMALEASRLFPDLGRLYIIPFGIDLNVFDPYSCVALSDNNFTDKIIVGTVKTLSYNYGIDTLIEAFGLAKLYLKNTNSPLHDHVKLVIVGAGTSYRKYVTLANKLGLASEVEFIGSVRHSEVPSYLLLFDIFASLSRSESFGVAVLEASAMNLPVVTSSVGGLPEVVVNNVTGYIVSPDNPTRASEAIIALLESKHLRKRFGHAGRKFVSENFSWPVSLKKMVGVYTKLLQ